MAEPQPPTLKPGATTTPPVPSGAAAAAADDEPTSTTGGPGGAEGRKAAAALSSLGSTSEASQLDSASVAKSEADKAALSEAMNRLEIFERAEKIGKGELVGKSKDKGKEEEEKVVKRIKVDKEDVEMLMHELEVNRQKATEMVKAWGQEGEGEREYVVEGLRLWVRGVRGTTVATR